MNENQSHVNKQKGVHNPSRMNVNVRCWVPGGAAGGKEHHMYRKCVRMMFTMRRLTYSVYTTSDTLYDISA